MEQSSTSFQRRVTMGTERDIHTRMSVAAAAAIAAHRSGHRNNGWSVYKRPSHGHHPRRKPSPPSRTSWAAERRGVGADRDDDDIGCARRMNPLRCVRSGLPGRTACRHTEWLVRSDSDALIAVGNPFLLLDRPFTPHLRRSSGASPGRR